MRSVAPNTPSYFKVRENYEKKMTTFLLNRVSNTHWEQDGVGVVDFRTMWLDHRIISFDLYPTWTHSTTTNLYPVQVTWRPPQQYLQYNELYRGIPEYLRAPPTGNYREAAMIYLGDIHRNNHLPMKANPHYIQNHRILWIREWLQALPDDASECSDTDTVVGDREPSLEEVW